MNLGQAKRKALELMDEYSNNGTAISQQSNIDYLVRMNNFADEAQKEIAQFKPIYAVYKISQNPVQNQLANGFMLVQHLEDDVIFSATGSKSYYFEMDGQGDVYIEENISGVWTTLDTINVNVTSFTAFKGLVTANDDKNDIRLRFTGSYPYNIQNVALYAVTFPTDNDVQPFKRELEYTMPSTFRELKQVVERDERGYIRNSGSYRWMGKHTLLVPHEFRGSLEIEHYAYPSTIPAGDLNDVTSSDHLDFEIEEEAQELIPFYMASKCLLREDPAAATVLFNMYQNKLANLDTSDIQGIVTISNPSGW